MGQKTSRVLQRAEGGVRSRRSSLKLRFPYRDALTCQPWVKPRIYSLNCSRGLARSMQLLNPKTVAGQQHQGQPEVGRDWILFRSSPRIVLRILPARTLRAPRASLNDIRRPSSLAFYAKLSLTARIHRSLSAITARRLRTSERSRLSTAP